MKYYKVTLEETERIHLEAIISKGKHESVKVRRANVLLAVDQSPEGKGWTDAKAHQAFGMSIRQIERLRKRFVEYSFEVAFNGKKREPNPPQFDGEVEAHIIALACGQVPQGYVRWTLRMLAEKAVEMEYVESISHESVRKLLKKRNQTLEKTILGDTSGSKC